MRLLPGLDRMTPLKISYGHGWLTDCDDLTGWNLYTQGGILNAAKACDYEDRFRLEGSCRDLIDEKVYIEKDVLSLGISTTLYPTAISRWVTSQAASALGTQIQLLYSDATWQYLLSTVASDPTPKFSTNFTRTITTLLPGKTISKIRFIADDYPDGVGDPAYNPVFSSISSDFLLICQGILTFPYVDEAYDVDLPQDHQPLIPIISRMGDETQHLGQGLATVHAQGTMDSNNAWKGVNGVVGEALYSIKLRRHLEPFQWFEDGMHGFKVTPAEPFQIMPTTKAEAKYNINLVEYRHSCASHEQYYERLGLLL